MEVMQQILIDNKFIAHLSQSLENYSCFLLSSLKTSLNLRFVMSSFGLKNESTYFLILIMGVGGGGLGVLPRKIFETNKAGEVISGHF